MRYKKFVEIFVSLMDFRSRSIFKWLSEYRVAIVVIKDDDVAHASVGHDWELASLIG